MKAVTSLLIAIIAFLTLSSFIPTAQECEIYNSTVRLHVIANSDSESDQALKLKVRDAIVEDLKNCGATSKEEAVSYIESEKEKLENIADTVLEESGSTDRAVIKIGKEDYPTREYENFALPAGNYTSVRVIIGNGEGKNWWCVLFPPLCTAAAMEYDEENCVDVGLTQDQYRLITGTNGEYKVKFKLLEIAADAFGVKYD